MITLKGEHIYLRALDRDDLDFIHQIENDEELWELSQTIAPYSRFVLEQYLENSHRDIYEVKQLRLVICNHSEESIGMIDLFDFDFKNRRAGVGILVKDVVQRKKGYGKEALHLLTNYAKNRLNLHQLYCNIIENNNASLKLFQSENFEIVGLKKDWSCEEGQFKNEYLLQRILK